MNKAQLHCIGHDEKHPVGRLRVVALFLTPFIADLWTRRLDSLEGAHLVPVCRAHYDSRAAEIERVTWGRRLTPSSPQGAIAAYPLYCGYAGYMREIRPTSLLHPEAFRLVFGTRAYDAIEKAAAAIG